MDLTYIDIRVKGRSHRVPSVAVDNLTVIARGTWFTSAALADEELHILRDPLSMIDQLRRSPLNADIFTFTQTVPDVSPRFPFLLEWDNAAVAPTSSYTHWLEKRAAQDVRKAIKKAARLGVSVRQAKYDDAFVHGICNIYNDTPVRQGNRFWHYGKDFDAVKFENGTYLERSTFVGAYFEDELIGFIKYVSLGNVGTTLQVISQTKHFDKKPMNALIAKAVELCAAQGLSHLIYGSYVYDGHHSSLTEFKRRNGFEQVLVPRYYVPLTLKGRAILDLRLHRKLSSRLPKQLVDGLRQARRRWHRGHVAVTPEASER